MEFEYNFFYPLTLAKLFQQGSVDEKKEYMAAIEICENKMANWSLHSPQNFYHKYTLIKAEKARVQNRLEAIDLYDEAIKSAEENDFLQDAGSTLVLRCRVICLSSFYSMKFAYGRF
jgi:histidine kinase